MPVDDHDNDDAAEDRQALRRVTLLLATMLDALGELKDAGGVEEPQTESLRTRSRLDRMDAAFLGEHGLGKFDRRRDLEVSDGYEKFESHVNRLLRQLRVFSNAVAQLGSSATLLASSADLCKSLARVLSQFRLYAAVLLPHKFRKRMPKLARVPTVAHPKLRYKLPDVVAPDTEEVDPRALPDELQGLAESTTQFLTCLKDFAVFRDETLSANTRAFERDLKYWASGLRDLGDQLDVSNSPAHAGIARYVHCISAELGEHLEHITKALDVLIEVRVPTMRSMQDRYTASFMYLTTISTFFSGVTVTTLQFSYNKNASRLDAWVNAFWYSSLVFSVASAVNSLIGLTWMQAIFRSPDHRVPWWLVLWIKRAPVTFLAVSILSFSVGFVLFTFDSGQRPELCIVVAVLTIFSSLGIVAVSCWLLLERWVFLQQEGQVCAHDLLKERTLTWRRQLGLDLAMRVLGFAAHGVALCWNGLVEICHRVPGLVLSLVSAGTRRGGSVSSHPDIEPGIPKSAAASAHSIQSRNAAVPAGSLPTHPAASSSIAQKEANRAISLKRTHLAKLVMRDGVELLQQQTKVPPSADDDLGQRPRARKQKSIFGLSTVTSVRVARLTDVRPALSNFAMAHSIRAHQLAVRYLAFSPDGKFLATASSDQMSCVIDLSNLDDYKVLGHGHGQVEQIVWSPDGATLLTNVVQGVNIWSIEGVRERRINSKSATYGVSWFPNGTEFLTIEANKAMHWNLRGRALEVYHLDGLRLHDIMVGPKGNHFFAIASLERSKDGLEPVQVRKQKRLIAFNCLLRMMSYQVPLFHDASNLTLSSDGKYALIGYEDKTPPELWQVDPIEYQLGQRVRTYWPKHETKFSGRCCFGGNKGDLVVSASKGGNVYIWDRDSATLLHVIATDGHGDRPNCIAWNHRSEDGYMFATGTHEGTVQIWRSSPAQKRAGQCVPSGDGDSVRPAVLIPQALSPVE